MRQIIKRAFQDTRIFFGWNKRSLVFLILWVVGCAILWQWQGAQAVTEEIHNKVAFVLIPVAAFAFLLFLFHLIRAPVYLRLEKEKEPKLEIVEVKEANYQQMGQTHGLVIKNKGVDRVEDCRGQLIEIEFANPERGQSMCSWPTNRYLTWAEQEGDWKTKEPFIISGKDSKVLQVIIFRYVDGKPVVEIAYSANEELRINNAVTHFEDAYMVISVTSLNCLPIYAVCRYRRTSDTMEYPQLVLRDVTKDKPTISSYQQLNKKPQADK